MESSKKTGLVYRLVASVLFFSFVLVNTFFELGVTQEEPTGIEDKVHLLLSGANKFFKEYSNLKNVLIIISNIILDISTLFIIIIWLAFMKNLRLFCSITIFFTIKVITQSFFLVRPPIDNLVEFPGFPSLFYSYKLNNFFFFSGTTGFSVILIYEFFEAVEKVKFSKIFYLINIANLFFFSFLSLCIFSLYTVDILMGVIVAHYSIRISIYFHPSLDRIFFAEEINENKDFFNRIFASLEIQSEKKGSVIGEKRNIAEVVLTNGNEEIIEKEKDLENLEVNISNNIVNEKTDIYNNKREIL